MSVRSAATGWWSGRRFGEGLALSAHAGTLARPGGAAVAGAGARLRAGRRALCRRAGGGDLAGRRSGRRGRDGRARAARRQRDAFDALALRINRMLDRIGALMSELRLLTDGLAHDLRSPVGRLRRRVERALACEDAAQRDAAARRRAARGGRAGPHPRQGAGDRPDRGRAGHARLRSRSTLPNSSPSWPRCTRRRWRMPASRWHWSATRRAAPLLGAPPTARAGAQQPARQCAPIWRGRRRGDAVRRGRGRHAAPRRRRRGPGIPAGRRGDALRRFGRLDSARTAPGAGLGLALVEAVARPHGGRWELGDGRAGTGRDDVSPAAAEAFCAAQLSTAALDCAAGFYLARIPRPGFRRRFCARRLFALSGHASRWGGRQPARGAGERKTWHVSRV